MVIHVYLSRHGPSKHNEDNVGDLVIGGRNLDTQLSADGIEKVVLQGLYFQREGITFDLILRSPARRTIEHSIIIAEMTGYPLDKIIDDEAFLEINNGSAEGKIKKEIIGDREDPRYKDYYFNPNTRLVSDAESYVECAQRGYSGLVNHTSKISDGNVYLAGHQKNAWGTIQLALKQELSPAEARFMENASFSRLDFDGLWSAEKEFKYRRVELLHENNPLEEPKIKMIAESYKERFQKLVYCKKTIKLLTA